MARFKEVTGYAREVKTILANAGQPVSGAGFEPQADGSFFLTHTKTSSTIVYPISADLHIGDVIKKFRVLGALGASSGKATVINASLRKVTKGTAGAPVDAQIGAITQVSVQANAALSAEASVNEIVAKDFQYYVLVTATTDNDTSNSKAYITGIELDLNSRGN